LSLDNLKEYVGYKRPPKSKQWKKGQCGNPKRQYARLPKPPVQIIDKIFAKKVTLVENGIARRVEIFQVIVGMLTQATVAGEKRAATVLQEYWAFAHSEHNEPKSEVEVVYLNSAGKIVSPPPWLDH